MTKHNGPNTNFWFGFAVGSVTLSAMAYFMGTKKGRDQLKKFLEYADNIEDIPEELMSLLPALQGKFKEQFATEYDHVEHSEHKSTLESIMEKMQQTTQKQKQVKKFFVKGGKIIDQTIK